MPTLIDVELGALIEQQVCNEEANRLIDSIGNNQKMLACKQQFDKLTQSEMLLHQKDFKWNIHFIKDDSTVNAFCLPGGHVFVYTGLLNLTDNSSEIAGVLAHEIAHAELRHSLQQIIQQYGFQFVLEGILGINSSWLGLGLELVQLKFSRSDEQAADEFAFHMLQSNQIDTDGLISFFKKMEQTNSNQLTTFLSTHPDTRKRIQHIQSLKTSKN